MTWRARFWHDDNVAHVIDFDCDNPLLLEDALDQAMASLPEAHFAWTSPITVSPK